MNLAARLSAPRFLRPALTRALLLLSALCALPAAAQSPTPQSPAVPTPYSWPGFHAGGASPVALAPVAPYTAALLTPPAPDALFGMLQGTPTGLVAGPYDAEIPSFLLGNYNPANPPTGGGVNDFVVNHFADDIFSIPSTVTVLYSPFASLNQTLNAQANPAITADDQDAASFALTNGSVTPPYGGGTAPAALPFPWTTGLADGTATDGSAAKTGAKYSRVPVAVDAQGSPLSIATKVVGGVTVQKVAADKFAVAVWSLTAPVAGSYTVTLHLPDPVDNSAASTSPNKPEYRIPDAHYVVRDDTGKVLADTRISQQETNSPQFLAGPFPLNPSQQITVTLDNSTFVPVTIPPNSGLTVAQAAAATYVLADSVTLAPAGNAGDVQSSPVAVNVSEYPEIANALYWGYNVNTAVSPPTYTDELPTNPAPYNVPTGNQTIGVTPPTTTPPTEAQQRRIRQMVYFGRSENITLVDANGNLRSQPVGAIYGIDGNTGSVVWRFQTPGGSTTTATGFLATGLAGQVASSAFAGAPTSTFQIGPTANVGQPTQEGVPTLDTPPGTIAAYTAYSGAPTPQINGDISKYGFALYAKTATIISPTETDFSGTFRFYAPGYPPNPAPKYTTDDGQILEHGTFTTLKVILVSPNTYRLSGQLTADPGTLQPPGWPTAVDLSGGNPLQFTATLRVNTTTGVQTLTDGVLRSAGALSAPLRASSAVFSTPTVARIHVYTGKDASNTDTYATRLVVIAADNAGFVYCLDAVGNRDGYSNSRVVDTALDQPIYATNAQYHVGTTKAYWVYRPDATQPKDPLTQKLKARDPNSDLPVPGAFGLASPTVDIVTRLTPDTTTPPITTGVTTGVPADTVHDVNSAFIYIGNTNGTLYKLNTLGVPVTANDLLLPANTAVPTGDPFNGTLSLTDPAIVPAVQIPTPQAQWWLPINNAVTGGEAGTDSITSAPAIRISDDVGNVHTTTTQIYFTTANDANNSGRLYRVDSAGPEDNTKTGATPTLAVPGTPNYNLRAQALWSFPNGFSRIRGLTKTVRPALGSIGGSPVLFGGTTDKITRAYFAANVRQEAIKDASGATVSDTAVLNAGDAGRIWSVNIDATTDLTRFNWAYPSANNPNDPANDLTAKPVVPQPQPPIGGFRNATPAVGIVQFPKVIEYGMGGSNNYDHTDFTGSVKGRQVPMLYVGSVGTGDVLPRMYGIDLDDGNTTDAQRTVFDDFTDAAGAPFSANGNRSTDAFAVAHSGLLSTGGFVSSPALIVNSNSTGSGNGGALFIAETDGALHQFDATPQSNDTSGTSTATGPDFGDYPVFRTAGPYSSPAVAAFDATDLNGTVPLPGSTISGKTTVDWVYFGDSGSGECVGITPGVVTNFGSDGGFGTNPSGGGNGEYIPPPVNLPQFPLHVYLFKNTVAKPNAITSTNIADAVPTDGFEAAPAYEWGENVYIRVANVVPPAATNPIYPYKSDPSIPNTYYLINGSPVSIQISETNRLGVVDVNRGSDVGQVPATYLGTTLSGPPPPNGIVQTATPEPNGLVDNLNKGYLGAYTYAIGNGSGRKNTPGSRRRIITATQTAQLYGPNPANGGTVGFLQTVTLSATVRPAGSGRTVTSSGGVRTRVYQKRVDQPTFAVLNPLALAGYGLPIASISSSPMVQPLGSKLGPFGPLMGTSFDLPAYSNGNRVYQNVGDLPKNGVLAGGNAANRPVTQQVLTTTGMISHGLSGSNTDVTSGSPLVSFADRSALGVTGRSLRITMLGTPMNWNDNSLSGGEAVNGANSVINPLPWEDSPVAARAGTNHSLDYPDITSRAVRQTLTRGTQSLSTLTNAAGTPDPATGTNVATRAVTPDSLTDPLANHVRVQINAPRFQPANTQLYQLAAGVGTPIAPRAGIDTTQLNFPMGYTAQMRVFVDSDNNKQYTQGEAYRDLTVYTGVPIDMGTQITNNTIDLGVLTQGHGVQTLAPYDPYSTPFQTYFKPVTAFNTGNVNLLNVLFDQRIRQQNTAAGTDTTAALPFGAGPLDGNAILPAYDFYGVTGATASGPSQPYILRTSLDSNLDFNAVTQPVSGKDPRNPAVIAVTGVYPGSTFHKARPGDAGPSVLTVPDISHDNIAGTGYYVAQTTDPLRKPQAGSYAAPFLSLEVPIGTPVGTYSQNVRLFEGLASYNGFAGPQYGTNAGSYGGVLTPTNLPNSLTFLDGTATQPYSSAVVVKTTVTEVRNTDGASAGTLPHIDAGPAGAGATSRADFGPAAFRNVFWTGGTSNFSPTAATPVPFGNINLYWTTARDAATGLPNYNIAGRRLPFTVAGGYGFFDTTDGGTDTSPTAWYKIVAPNPTFAPNVNGVLFPDTLTAGLNTNVSVAQEQHVLNGNSFNSSGDSYLFVQNLAAFGGAATGAPVYQNRIYCYQITPATGQLTATPSLVSSDPAQAKFGVKGLKIANNTSFADPLGGTAIARDLWAFWGSGARGRASVAYTSTLTSGGSLSNSTWTPTAALPLPEGLTSASDPSAVLVDAPDQTPANFGNDVKALDVTYTGIGADGNTDVYVSRYRPYTVRNAANATTSTIGLALSPFPAIQEFLQADSQAIYWRARDTAWVRDITQLDVTVNNTPLGLPTLAASKAPQFDRASGTLIYTGDTGPILSYKNAAGVVIATGQIHTTYIDLVRGRVRFQVKQPPGPTVPGTRYVTYLPTDAFVTAFFAPQARRITTDPRADTEPVSFLDEAFQPNLSGLGRVQANRAWYVWRKSGSAGTSTQPTLYFKTQRLTVVLTDAAGKPVSIALNGTTGQPTVTVSFAGGTLYSPAAGGVADIDWARGRIYLPLTFNGYALEGQTLTVTGNDASGNPLQAANGGKVYWLDEPRYNDIKNLPVGTEAVSTSETAVPLSTAVNEGTVCAFLDPMAYADVKAGAYDPLGTTGTNHADQPHKVWLYWSSTRNGTADIYSQAIEPRFAPLITASTGP